MSTMSRTLLSALALACSSTWLHAAEEIATDRPDVVESSEVVGKGRVQVETSYATERESKHAPKTRVQATPTLLRIGLTDTLEARIETDGYTQVKTWEGGESASESGLSDLALGIKWHVRTPAENESGPSMAWLFHVDTPTGSKAFRGSGLRPSARLVSEWDFNSWSLGVMPGLYVDKDDADKRYVGGILAIVVGKPITDKFRIFGEWAGHQLTTDSHGGNVITGNLGMAYLLSNTVQIDMAVSKGLTDAAPKQAMTFGLSILY